MAQQRLPARPDTHRSNRVFAASSRPRWPARSSSGTSSSSTPPPRRWSSTRSCSRRRTTRSPPIIAAFVTYAVGFIARPLGGIVFGHFGDKYGRKKLLQVAIILVGVATFLMGCLPTYEQVGFLAAGAAGHPALRAGLRRRRRVGRRRAARRRALPRQVARLLGLVPAGRRPDRQPARDDRAAGPEPHAHARSSSSSWGWRIGFWLSVVIVAVGYYIRTRVTDAPIFLEVQKQVEEEEHVRYGVLEVLQPLPARRLHRDGPALRREHHVLPRRDVLDHLPASSTRSTPPRSSATWSSRTSCT